MLISTFCLGMIVLTLGTGTAHGEKTVMPPSCNAPIQIFPGDGYDNPDGLDVSGHGPALSYQDNGDGTFTDCNTKLMWEEKTGDPEQSSVFCKDASNCPDPHNVINTYTWTDSPGGTEPNGTLFTLFLDQLNNHCDGDATKNCDSDSDCGGDGPCGFAGHRDWRIPNVKELQSIVDYSVHDPAWSAPGAVKTSFTFYYWSATTYAFDNSNAWSVYFSVGGDDYNEKYFNFFARAVRP
jgi:hypothetical protein